MTSSWIIPVLLVGSGGFLGSLARYGLSLTAQRLPWAWPAGTMAANLLGCLLIGMVAGVSWRGGTIAPEARLFFATGFCGGFTTMSSMVFETAEMMRSGEQLHATAYLAGSLLLSTLAFALGVLAVRVMIKP